MEVYIDAFAGPGALKIRRSTDAPEQLLLDPPTDEARHDRSEYINGSPVGYTSDDRSATTPGWSDSFLSWWNRLISRRDRADRSSLSATWSITLRPPKPSAAVAIVIPGGMASRSAPRISGGA